jgi:group I intron endonuclease
MEKNIVSIYKITNTLNGKIYIGFDICYPKRIKQHYNDSQRGKNSPLCNDIREYGWDNFSKELIYQSWDPFYCLKIMENYFIIEYNSYVDGYNRTLGGNGSLGSPRPKSEKQIKQMSKYMRENNPRKGYKFTKEEKERHSQILKTFYQQNPDKILHGEKNGMFGKNHTEEWRINHSQILKEKYKNGEIKKIEKVKCNYCDLTVIPGNLKRHERVCEKNPNKQKRKKRKLLS